MCGNGNVLRKCSSEDVKTCLFKYWQSANSSLSIIFFVSGVNVFFLNTMQNASAWAIFIKCESLLLYLFVHISSGSNNNVLARMILFCFTELNVYSDSTIISSSNRIIMKKDSSRAKYCVYPRSLPFLLHQIQCCFFQEKTTSLTTGHFVIKIVRKDERKCRGADAKSQNRIRSEENKI